MTYDDIYEQWREWAHRPELTDSFMAFILTMVNIELGEKLKSQVNEMQEILTLDVSAADLPDDFKKMRSVHNGRDYIPYIPPQSFEPGYYSIESNILIANETVVDIIYWKAPETIGDGTDDKVLSTYPNLYLYGGLSHIGRFLHDPSIIVPNEQNFERLLMQINSAAEEQRIGNLPTIRN